MTSPMRRVAVLLALCGLAPAVASASQTVKLSVAFTPPSSKGAGTTIKIHFRIATRTGRVPSPVTRIKFTLPPGINLGSSELGLATCSATILEVDGPASCSPNAILGLGAALSEVPFGPVIVREPVTITIYSIEPVGGHTAMIFYVDGKEPVSAHLLFPAVLLPGAGGSAYLNTVVPVTPSLPGAPDAAVVDIHATLGPDHLTYYKRVHGRLTGFTPAGIAIPAHCPPRGLRFTATFGFQDGSTGSSSTLVRCPRRN